MSLEDEVLSIYERMQEIDNHYFIDLCYIERTKWFTMYWSAMYGIFNSMTWDQQVYYCANFSFHNDKFKELLSPEQLATLSIIK